MSPENVAIRLAAHCKMMCDGDGGYSMGTPNLGHLPQPPSHERRCRTMVAVPPSTFTTFGPRARNVAKETKLLWKCVSPTRPSLPYKARGEERRIGGEPREVCSRWRLK